MPVFETYSAVGEQEDVHDDIYLISPVDNPVASMSRAIRANAKIHQYQTDALRAAKANLHVEGADANDPAHVATEMLSQPTQIMKEEAEVSGTLEAVSKYGRDSEMAYQLSKKYGELAIDEETAIMGAPGGTRQEKQVPVDNTTPRRFDSFHNQVDADNIVDAALFTTVAELEDAFNDAHIAAFRAGGRPRYATVSPENNKYIAAFAGAAGRTRDLRNERVLVNVIDLYSSKQGDIDIVLDLNQDACIAGHDFEYSANAVLRPTEDYPLARIGDADRREIIRESAFCLLNPKAHFLVDNIPDALE